VGADDDRAGALDATLQVTPSGGAVAREPTVGASVDRYRLVARLGAGAMGVVWAARDPELDRPVAIKLVHPDLARDPEAAARLLREARAMAKVSHRNVVAIHDAGRDGEQLFIAMELVAGTTLGQLLAKRSPAELRDWRRWLALVRDAGRGLAAAHAAGVVHRDFKPENVLVDRAGRVCVGDFGVAELSAPTRSARWKAMDPDLMATIDDLTTTGALIGTPAYMSPEQLRGLPADARSDQFAFSVAAWEVLFGQRPFPLTPPPGQAALPALLAAIEAGEPEAPRITPVPRRIREALVRGLAADPSARFPDLPALLAALSPRSRWRPALAAAAAVVALAVVAAVVMRPGDGDGAAPAVATVKRKFPVALKVSVSLSPDGKRVSLAAPDQLVVRELDGRASWTLPLRPDDGVERAVFVGDEVHCAVRTNKIGRVIAWTPETGATRELAQLGEAAWLGHVEGGDLVQEHDAAGGAVVRIVGADGGRDLVTLPRRLEVWSIAPDGKRLAYVADAAFDGRIVIVDLATGTSVQGPPLVEITGLTWRDHRRLLYTTGTLERPAVHEVTFTGGRFGSSRKLYQAETGWFGQIQTGGGRVVYVDSTNSFRARLVRPPTQVDLDATRISAGLAWEPDGAWLSWNRTTGDIERRVGTSDARATLAADVSGEPGNATRAGRTLVLSMRRTGGRELLALSLDDGQRLWTKPVGDAVLARCAADDHPPCFAVVHPTGEAATLRTLDPVTGAIGDEVLYTSTQILDIAVADDGDEVLVVDGTKFLRRIALPARTVSDEIVGPSTLRSVAYHPAGGFVIAGSGGAARYLALWKNGPQTSVLLRAESEILFLPRPSPDGSQLLLMGRLFLPELYELVL